MARRGAPPRAVRLLRRGDLDHDRAAVRRRPGDRGPRLGRGPALDRRRGARVARDHPPRGAGVRRARGARYRAALAARRARARGGPPVRALVRGGRGAVRRRALARDAQSVPHARRRPDRGGGARPELFLRGAVALAGTRARAPGARGRAPRGSGPRAAAALPARPGPRELPPPHLPAHRRDRRVAREPVPRHDRPRARAPRRDGDRARARGASPAGAAAPPRGVCARGRVDHLLALGPDRRVARRAPRDARVRRARPRRAPLARATPRVARGRDLRLVAAAARDRSAGNPEPAPGRRPARRAAAAGRLAHHLDGRPGV